MLPERRVQGGVHSPFSIEYVADGETMLQHALHRCNSVGYALHLQSLSDDAFSAVLGCATLVESPSELYQSHDSDLTDGLH